MDEVGQRRLLHEQDGVVSRAQLRDLGADKHELQRCLRRRELVVVHPGVYVDHTGPLTDRQRVWAAVLHAAPAALWLESALDEAHDPVHVAIDETRRVDSRPGVRVHRVKGLHGKVHWNLSPPRARIEEAVVGLVDLAPSETDVVRLLTEPVNGRRTTADRLRSTVEARSRLRRRPFVLAVLDDVERGVCSVLEHRYLTCVERAHGLPRASRQSPRQTPSGREYRDVDYDQFGVVVELDGRLGHDTWDASGRDADRDLDDRASGKVVVRLRYAQVLDRPCRTAVRIASILHRAGWNGRLRRCGRACGLSAA